MARAPAIAVFLATAASCGGSNRPTSIPGLSIGGTYDTQVSLLPEGNTCGAVQVQNNTTVIDHQPASPSISLTHAGNTYPGTVDGSGRFSTAPRRVGGSFDVSITGQFGATGFDATAQVQQSAPPCGYRVQWVGTKNGAPNTFP